MHVTESRGSGQGSRLAGLKGVSEVGGDVGPRIGLFLHSPNAD